MEILSLPLSGDQYLAAEREASLIYGFKLSEKSTSDDDILSYVESQLRETREPSSYTSNDSCSAEEQDLIQDIVAAEIAVTEAMTARRPLPPHFCLNSTIDCVLSRRLVTLTNWETRPRTLYLNPRHPGAVVAGLLDRRPCAILESRQLHYLYQDRFIERAFSFIMSERMKAAGESFDPEDLPFIAPVQTLASLGELGRILKAFGSARKRGGLNFVHMPWWMAHQQLSILTKPFDLLIIDALTLPEYDQAALMLKWAIYALDLYAVRSKAVIVLNSSRLSPQLAALCDAALADRAREYDVEILTRQFGTALVSLISNSFSHQTADVRTLSVETWKKRQAEAFYEMSQEQSAASTIALKQLELLSELLLDVDSYTPHVLEQVQDQSFLDEDILQFLTGGGG